MSQGFIERFGLWSDEQAAAAEKIRRWIADSGVRLIRMAWADTHGHARAKMVSVPVFLESLTNGYVINVATFTLDASGGRVFRSFVRGGGMKLDEMTGSPNLTVVPDPETFRVLPWAPDVAWVICDEYFTDGKPFHFSARQVLRRQIDRLSGWNMSLKIGLEVEWYLRRIADPDLTDGHTATPGMRGTPIATAPVEPGYSYHSESNMDLMQPVLSELASAYEELDLPLRSIENEFGPGQIECTFSAQDALRAADNMVLFRSATRQVCRRLGHIATFMCRPAFPGFYASGWHLHQSLTDPATGENLCTPDDEAAYMSPTGMSWLSGLLEHAAPSSIFATPTVNGYRRFQPNSLAPDRATWSHDHRGVMVRLLGGVGDKATRYENRIGEPAANPYLYIASQIIAGLDGVERQAEPWPADDEPYESDRPPLPKSLGDALVALGGSKLYEDALGPIYHDYFIALKKSELSRYTQYLDENPEREDVNGVTAWEQHEYFDFF